MMALKGTVDTRGDHNRARLQVAHITPNIRG